MDAKSMRKRAMKVLKTGCIVALASITGVVALVVSTVAWKYRSPISAHWDKPLPSSAELAHYQALTSGFDRSYLFEFKVRDDALQQRLISEWDLVRAHPLSFAKTKAPEWWDRTAMQTSTEKYGRVDEELECYWSVWVPEDKSTVFVEYGKW